MKKAINGVTAMCLVPRSALISSLYCFNKFDCPFHFDSHFDSHFDFHFPATPPPPLLRVAPPSFFLGQLDLGRRGEPYRVMRYNVQAVGFVPTTLGDNLKS